MTYARIATAIFAAMIPFSALASDTMSLEILNSVISETRPETLFLKVMKESEGQKLTVMLTGAREGGLTGKMWTKTSFEWKSGKEWMNFQVEMRLKNNKAYCMIRTVSNSSDVPVAKEFSDAAGIWYELDLQDPAIKNWFMPRTNATAFGSLFDVERTKYKAGYSNVMSLIATSTSLRSALSETLPLLLVPDSMDDAKLKIDTNSVSNFQYASLKADHFEARVQRQLGAVYVETPKIVQQLPKGEISSFFFSPVSGVHAPVPTQVTTSSSSSAKSVNHDHQIEMRLPSTKNSVVTGVIKRSADRAIIDLVGPNGINLKRTVRLAVSPAQWNSLSAFRFDFSRDGGILYVFPSSTKRVFTTKDAYAPLDIIFFDENGSYISSVRMPKCDSDVCPEYLPTKPAKFALQVEEGFLVKHDVGELWRLDLTWYKLPQTTDLSKQEINRLARRNIIQRQALKAPTAGQSIGETGYESLRTLVTLLASKVRPDDITALSSPTETKIAQSLYTMLFDTVKANAQLSYAYIVRPTDAPHAFALLVDNFTFASFERLDVDKSGALESDEEPAKVGTLYRYPALTQAVLKTTFVDLSDNGDITVFAPVRDENGIVIALVAVVQNAPSSN